MNAEVPSVSPRLDPVFRRALAKDPRDRYETTAAFVAALREALEGAPATTRVVPVARRSALPLVAAFVAAAALGGAGLAALLTRGDGGASAQPVTTLQTTAPQEVPPPPPPEPPPPPLPPPPPAVNAVALTDQATQLLREGDYEGAERLARQAVEALRGSGQLYEAYAEYDLGAALAGLGRCGEALQHLSRSEALQGERKEIRRARKACRRNDDDDDD